MLEKYGKVITFVVGGLVVCGLGISYFYFHLGEWSEFDFKLFFLFAAVLVSLRFYFHIQFHKKMAQRKNLEQNH